MLYALLSLKYRVVLFNELGAITCYFSKTVAAYIVLCLTHEKKKQSQQFTDIASYVRKIR